MLYFEIDLDIDNIYSTASYKNLQTKQILSILKSTSKYNVKISRKIKNNSLL